MIIALIYIILVIILFGILVYNLSTTKYFISIFLVIGIFLCGLYLPKDNNKGKTYYEYNIMTTWEKDSCRYWRNYTDTIPVDTIYYPKLK